MAVVAHSSGTGVLVLDGTVTGPGGEVVQTNGEILGDYIVSNNAAVAGKLSLTGGTISGSAASNSLVRMNTMEFQPYALNNGWFGENVYFDGTTFRHRATGSCGLFYFQGSEGQFRFYPSATAGTEVPHFNPQFKVIAGGTVAMGGLISFASGSTFGATLVVNGSGANVTGALAVTGTAMANLFSGSGASLTNLPAANLTGSVPSAALTSIPAGNLTGTVATARLGSGTASSATALFGDQTYKAVVTASTTDTFTNKSISGATNTITNIGNSSLSAGIDAAKIADGTISNTEFQYLNGVTSNIQAQINAVSGGTTPDLAAVLTEGNDAGAADITNVGTLYATTFNGALVGDGSGVTAIQPDNISGYPSDGSQFLNGAGSWSNPLSGGITQTFDVMDGDGVTVRTLVFTNGLLTSYT